MARAQQQDRGDRGQSSTERAVAIQSHQVAEQNEFLVELERYAPNFADALPPEIPVAHFKRVIITAIASNPDLVRANRRTLFNSCMKAAADGLLPDGREGALVVYKTQIKTRDPDSGTDKQVYIEAVQWMPMVHGIRKRMRNSGEVLSAKAEAVYRNDHFKYRLGDDEFIDHQPPPLEEDRGDVIGAYAIIRLQNGEVIRDVMGKKEIEAARNVSRAPNSPMWSNFYWEGAKKTVLRRGSKQAPLSPTMRRLMSRDEEDPFTGEVTEIPDATRHTAEHTIVDHVREPEPQRAGPSTARRDPPAEPQYAVIDLDGVESLLKAPAAITALEALLGEAEARGLATLDGMWQTNDPVIDLLNANGFGDQVSELAAEYDAARRRCRGRASRVSAAEGSPAAAGGQAASPPSDPAGGQQQTIEDDRFPGDLPAGERLGAAQGTGSPTPANDTPNPGPAPDAPAAANDGGNEAATEAEPAGDRVSMYLEPVMKGGKPDWRAWAVAKFLPKVRRQRDSASLAWLCGDNEASLAECRKPGALHRDDLNELEQTLKEQWGLVGNG